MEKIYSKVDPKVLLHLINKWSESMEKRVNISPEDEYLQSACITMTKGQTFRPHKHIEQVRTTDIAQESWVVIKGKVKAILYDLDDTIIAERILEVGDCSMTFKGGHNYEALEDDTFVYEYKTGPYQGQEKDKVFI